MSTSGATQGVECFLLQCYIVDKRGRLWKRFEYVSVGGEFTVVYGIDIVDECGKGLSIANERGRLWKRFCVSTWKRGE